MAHPNGYAIIPDDPFAPVVLGDAMHTQTGDTVVRIDRDVVHERLAGRGISLDPAEWAAAVASPSRDWYRFPFVVVDLFAGAGGSSSGILRALKALRVPTLLIQVNHWDRAVATQIVNFPNAIHLNASVETPDPREIILWGYVDLLAASPECVSYSVARGNKKIREQSRSSAAFLLTWLERVTVARFVFENVREWKTWGRLNKTGTATLKGYEGEYYRAFWRKLKSLGYKRAIDGVLNSADYGTPQCRHRLFVTGKLGSQPIAMPEPSHTQYPGKYPHRKPWRVAREIIDFSDKGQSSFCRFAHDGSAEGPHAVASLQRTRAGYVRQIPERPGAAAYAKAFELFIPIAQQYHDHTPPTPKSLENAKAERAADWRARYDLRERQGRLTERERSAILLASATEWRNRYGLGGSGTLTDDDRRQIRAVNVDRSRETTKLTFAEPIIDFVSVPPMAGSFTMAERTHSVARGMNLPLHAATSAGGGGLTLTQPTVMGQHAGSIARTVHDNPLMTVAGGGAISLAQPLLTRANASDSSAFDDATREVDRPFQTLVAKPCIGLAQPVLSDVAHGEGDTREHHLSEPMSALTAKPHIALNQPSIGIADATLVEVAHGEHATHQRRPKSLDEPLTTLHAGGGKFAVAGPAIEAEGFILSRYGDNGSGGDRAHSLGQPFPTATGSGAGYLVEPTLLPQHSAAPIRDTDSPLPTIVGIARIGLNQGEGPQPFIYEPHGERNTQAERVHDIDKPALTVTPRGAGTLVQPAQSKTLITDVEYKPKIRIDGQIFIIDSFFRMLRVLELSRAQDLVDERRGYTFTLTGSVQEQTKQLGNAVPSNVMEALAHMLCSDIVGLDEDTPLIDVLLAPLPLANSFGIYNERIIRRESGDALPTWFTPKENALHVGIHEPGGRHTYLELAENEAARTSLHPYEIDIVEQTDQATALELFPLAA
jgi:DNA (cytosine-5)-methyltransferase 1